MFAFFLFRGWNIGLGKINVKQKSHENEIKIELSLIKFF